ncbi:MAG: hypothetical protein IPI48_12235 [bacterium]|nr:hypothetical protein [bacterium]
MSGAKAERALVLGNIGVEFDGFAVSWFRRIMRVRYGTWAVLESGAGAIAAAVV